MKATTLHGIELVAASVASSDTFGDAVRALRDSRLSTIAVLEDDRVVGLFTDEELLLGISPGYLDELRHTRFVETELPELRERALAVSSETVAKHMRAPVTVELESGSLHAAERFVHSDEGALPVVDENDRFVGMLSRAEFAHALLRRLAAGDDDQSS